MKLRYFDTISLFLVRLGRLEITNTSGEKKRRRASRNAWTYWDPSFDCMGQNFYVCYFHIIRWRHHQFDLKDTSKIILHHCKRISKDRLAKELTVLCKGLFSLTYSSTVRCWNAQRKQTVSEVLTSSLLNNNHFVMFRLSLHWLKNNPPFLAVWLSAGFQVNDDWEKNKLVLEISLIQVI